MDRYWVKRGGDADRWGNWYVIDRTASTSVAMCEDADMAQRIADLLNGKPMTELVGALATILENIE